MRKVAPDLDVRVWPGQMGNVGDIEYCAAWLPPPGVLKSLPNLRVIMSLGAGADAILGDPTLPANIPIIRVNDPDLTGRMTEYIVLHVLMHHRQQRRIDANQRNRIWDSFPTHAAKDLSVGIMGMGVMGADSAVRLRDIGFRVAGWSRSRKEIPGIGSFAGDAEFDAFLARTDILVSLLPATPDTDGIINRAAIRKLSRKGPFGAPVVINAGRGRQQVADDILAALDAGELHAATLDVFMPEPLPPDSPLWTHPRVTVTPHCAADSDPETICAYVAANIRRHQRGAKLENLVDRARGY
ncbi:glyoxylate/hydroxypyruvate reductase A [Aestuariivirga sp.]|uniref:2-hydroxyacid dehydrogenase n=1 Tax=Aestuariivirga sp. TaxID=2650926 RepID=UPI0025B9DB02|nr:glyoxylate/hydroxypyruvate reductase A [Aestuariivirga sp.]MCA3554679.1 glyoxylate/hydroxypyruvate reductase A [Aestuariivirga sp.]